MMRKYVKFILNEFKHDSRNMREMDAVSELYDEIVVLCPQKTPDYINTSEYTVVTYKHFLSKKKPIRFFQIIYSLVIKIPRAIIRQKAHTISCQDLIALCIAWFSNLFVRRKAFLVYDSHELEIARNTNGRRGKIASILMRKLEQYLIKRVEFSIFACDSAALEVQNLYELEDKPLVIRNIPYRWQNDNVKCRHNRDMILSKYNLSADSFVCLYHGIIGYGRGIENLIKSISTIQGAILILLGMGDKNYIDSIKQLVDTVSPNKVIIMPAVDVKVLPDYVCIADVGLVTVQAVTKSYYYMLPNKFFENIQSENPIICSNFPEVKKIVEKYDIGITVNPDNVEEIRNSILLMKTDKRLYAKYKMNLKVAKEELCWENEKVILIERYKLIGKKGVEKTHV